MKRVLIIWLVALFSIVTIPAVSFVSADPSMIEESTDTTYTEADPDGWGKLIESLCIKNGGDPARCKEAGEAAQADLEAYNKCKREGRSDCGKNPLEKSWQDYYSKTDVNNPAPNTPFTHDGYPCACHDGVV